MGDVPDVWSNTMLWVLGALPAVYSLSTMYLYNTNNCTGWRKINEMSSPDQEQNNPRFYSAGGDADLEPKLC